MFRTFLQKRTVILQSMTLLLQIQSAKCMWHVLYVDLLKALPNVDYNYWWLCIFNQSYS